MTPLQTLRAEFDHVPGYLDAATAGLPARGTLAALAEHVETWRAGLLDPRHIDVAVADARRNFARVVGVPAAQVAIGAQTSALIAPVAASLPAGARVVVVENDFTSVTYPFLAQADRGVQVVPTPLERLAESVTPGTDLVAFSLVASCDGRIADADAIVAAAARVGARTLADLTQAAGWFPTAAHRFDITVTSAYKWLAAPRGAAFATVRPEVLGDIRPTAAGWYAGDDPWTSVYGTAMALAPDARRLDVSPAWPVWPGAAAVLARFADVDPALLRDHAVDLADAFLDGVGLPARGSAIVSLPDADGEIAHRLRAAGCRVAVRSGGVRIAFHVWNDVSDVERAARAVGNHSVTHLVSA